MRKGGFYSSCDIYCPDILHHLINNLPFSKGWGPLLIIVWKKISAIDYCQCGAKSKQIPPAEITTSDEHHPTLHWFTQRGNIEKAIWLVSLALCWNVTRLQCSFWQVGRFEEISQQTANISGQTVERTNNGLNCDLIRHLFGIFVWRNPSGAKCAARLKPAALECWWVDADWWGGGLKSGGEKGDGDCGAVSLKWAGWVE